MADFVHLHNHSDYSLQDGAFHVKNLVKATVENKMKAVALTEHGNMFSAIEFYKTAKSEGIKPIIGMEAYVATGGDRFSRPVVDPLESRRKKKPYNHLVLLVKNNTGYQNLCKLSSSGYLEGFYYRPRIDLELIKKYSEGLICLTACPAGVVAAHLVNEKYDEAKEVAKIYHEIFGDDLYLEIQDHNLDHEKLILEGMPKISKELGIKLVATNDCHYWKKEHSIAHNVLLHVADQRGTVEYKQLRYGTDQLYFKSADEMAELFKDFPGAVENTLEIADKCNVEIELKVNYFPNFPIPPDSGVNNLDDLLSDYAEKGIRKKLKNIDNVIQSRMDFELSVIKRMGYSGYFLIVQDFIKAAKDRNIAVGLGRGSAAGSLVAYALDITNVNPLEYDLLFERFLNPERVSMPDIDCDFADDKRDEIIKYVREKYGEENVCQIATFSHLTSKAGLKDVGRVLGLPIPEVEKITKYIPSEFGKVKNIADSIEDVPELKPYKNPKDEKIRELLDYSQILENMSRNISVHAAGVVISPMPLYEKVPLYYTKDTGLITQYDMKNIEAVGLIKMDFLGLITLTIIQDTLKLIRENHNVEIDIDNIPIDDEKTFDLFCNGKTVGVFQFDKKHTQDYLKRLKPRSIAELSAMNSLNRPGPMEYIDEFIDRKHGRKKISYTHQKLEPILKETYGIIIYQEQVIKIAHEIIGYSLAKADLMRRAMGKKDNNLMLGLEKEFIEGGVKNGIEANIGKKIFDEILKFANYGFNKSHSVAYSILAYQTAYLKAHYPVEFLTANLMHNLDKTSEITLYINECLKCGIQVLPPDVNESDLTFTVENKNSIRFGLVAIKNVGEAAVKCIIEERKKKKFKSIFDFCIRVDNKAINKRAMEGLTLAGAFDKLHPNRAELMGNLESAISYGQKKKENESMGLTSIFDAVPDSGLTSEPKMKKIAEWSSRERLRKEREILGFFSSSHPLQDYDLEVRSFSSAAFGDYETFENERYVSVCCVIYDIEFKMYQNTKTLAKFKLIDYTGEAEGIMFDNEVKKNREFLQEYNVLVAKGLASLKGDNLQIKVSEMLPIEEAVDKLGKGLLIDIINDSDAVSKLKSLKQVFSKNQGKIPVIINLSNDDINITQYKLKDLFIKLNKKLIGELTKIISSENIKIIPE